MIDSIFNFGSKVLGLFESDDTKRKKAELDNAKHQKVLEAINSSNPTDVASVKERGFKDEILLIITLFPLVGLFIEPLQPTIAQGFKELEALPDYYWYGLAMVYIDTFGFRQILKGFFISQSNKFSGFSKLGK